VLVIPTVRADGTRISNVKTQKAIKELVDFDPKEAYPGYPGMKKMSDHTKQLQMGMVSNLITDMTIGGAKPEEIVRAVKHSMVVIDAQKHKLNYKQSEKDNGIDELKRLYQQKEDGKYGGASTIISRAKSEARIPQRKRNWKPDKETGEWVYTDNPEYITIRKELKDGTVKETTREKLMKTTQMAITKDARDLMSGPNHEGMPIERAYAKYANDLKALANQARKEAVNTPLLQTDPAAKKLYANEVASLENKLKTAKSNAPRERQAQILAGEIIKARRAEDPDIDDEHLKKEKSLALANARAIVGAKKEKIVIEPKEWKAIQAGAISDNKLLAILNNADEKQVKQLAMPRSSNELSSSKQSLIKTMNASGYSIAEIADRLDISSSTVTKYM
jgi:DNA-directed RNA polymerase specialized sigma24 family protein